MKKLLFLALTVLLLAACGGNEDTLSADEVIQQFKDAGLDIGEISDLPNKEYGNTREEGKRILVPSLGEDSGGRLFVFAKSDDLELAKKYYDDLGAAGSMFYSHTHAADSYLLQMNGDMADEDFKKYADVLDSIVK